MLLMCEPVFVRSCRIRLVLQSDDDTRGGAPTLHWLAMDRGEQASLFFALTHGGEV